MITLVSFVWVPAVALVASIVYLMNWNKERFYLAILTLPAIYFMWKVLITTTLNPIVFYRRIIRTGLSLLIVILYLIRLNKTLSTIDCMCSFL